MAWVSLENLLAQIRARRRSEAPVEPAALPADENAAEATAARAMARLRLAAILDSLDELRKLLRHPDRDTELLRQRTQALDEAIADLEKAEGLVLAARSKLRRDDAEEDDEP